MVTDSIIAITKTFAEQVGALQFPAPVSYCYNPLDYAWETHRQYLERFAGQGQVLLLGMNPGPFGMAQTGVPFGSIPAVRDWMQLDGSRIGSPPRTHPKRPVLGFNCRREEPSGKRLWGLMHHHFPNPQDCFRHFLVMNFCPLVFMAESGANLTPDKLRGPTFVNLQRLCSEALTTMIGLLQPRAVVGIGNWAKSQLLANAPGYVVSQIPHPSPANPQANRDWAGQARSALVRAGLWPPMSA